MNDRKFAFRQLLKNPGFTTVAVLTLALGSSQHCDFQRVVHSGSDSMVAVRFTRNRLLS